ncbi:hypothetical protein SEA_PHELPSODU_56 [Mycobacterium phage PhelpsODU]|uniref:Uncharacterized protein n=1 Tax=Mycobacterium phage Unicorn TaxID=2015825 RepID=A0A222ZK35_9CAUD|nr:hypothetical protein I5G78_gp050 [Mycobacterium phage Unicorn]ASR85067.1 hypothetical protein SEA_UNICORN_56 [Mycobacterium phage Unicorn]ASR85166.1 hypothetical protein SEA_PHELPSODU_56 [Mycobacterium phage PhelpsODU]
MSDQAVETADSKRPWWADREVVETWVEQRHFDATLAYLDGLALAVEHRVAYGSDDTHGTAALALSGLDEVMQAHGGESALDAVIEFASQSWGDIDIERVWNG